jgi:hypothetical protein
MINMLVTHGTQRFLGAFSNLALSTPGDPSTARIGDSFGYLMNELHEPFLFSNGHGATRVIADGHLALLQSQLIVKPRKLEDHMKLLATVNRRVAAEDHPLSPFFPRFLPASRRQERHQIPHIQGR